MKKSTSTAKLKPAKTTSELRSVPGFSTQRDNNRGHRYEGLSYEDNESENWLKVAFCLFLPVDFAAFDFDAHTIATPHSKMPSGTSEREPRR
jgi:hypothetical protein